MVKIDVTRGELVVVRFQRDAVCSYSNRPFLDTDVIIVIKPEEEENLRADFAIYERMDDAAQRRFVERLRELPRYTGRLLSEQDLAPTVEQDFSLQTDMFGETGNL